MNFIVSALTDKGEHNEINQDSVVVRSAMTKCGHMCMAVICDGLGGLSRGEVASANVALKLGNCFMENASLIKSVKMAVNIIKKRMIEAGEELLSYGAAQGFAAGTTATVLLLSGNRYGFVHVGDTRIYKIGCSTSIITKDHCINERVLTQCVGGSEKIIPQTGFGRMGKGSLFLLCSDGFRHFNSEKIISSYYKKNHTKNRSNIDMHTKLLIKRCRYLGEIDNITAVVIKMV